MISIHRAIERIDAGWQDLVAADYFRLVAIIERVHRQAEEDRRHIASVAEREAITAKIHAALKEVTSNGIQ